VNNDSFTRPRKIFWIVYGIVLVFLAALLCRAIGLPLYISIRDMGKWKEYTIPVTETAKKDLCDKFSISIERLCEAGNDIYGPEFIPAIKNYYDRPTEKISREEVEENLGPYLVSCGGIIEQADATLIYCVYDFAGDCAFPISIRYVQSSEEVYFEEMFGSTELHDLNVHTCN
jgi:hypothetical protein